MRNINMEKKKIMGEQGLIKNQLIQNIGMERKDIFYFLKGL